MNRALPWTFLLALALIGCDGEPAAKNDQPKGPVNTPVAKPTALSMADLQSAALNTALVPSPVETQRALEKAGIADKLSSLIKDRKLKLDVDNKDVVAVRTGVVLADALLTVKESSKESLVERLSLVKSGMNTLGAGNDIQLTLDDLMARIKNDGVTRDDLVKELDELHGAIVPEINYEGGKQILPLLQAGSWLEGANLVATAVIAANKPESGSTILRQPQVVAYFQSYVQAEGPGRVPSDVNKQLDTALSTLYTIAQKRALLMEDIQQIKDTTDSVLALL